MIGDMTMSEHDPKLSRRDLLKAATIGGLGFATLGIASAHGADDGIADAQRADEGITTGHAGPSLATRLDDRAHQSLRGDLA